VTTEPRRADMANPCPAGAAWKDGPGWSNWGAGLANTRFQNAREAGLRAEDVPRLTLKWAFAFSDSAVLRSQPAVYRGRVFVGSQNGDVYAIRRTVRCSTATRDSTRFHRRFLLRGAHSLFQLFEPVDHHVDGGSLGVRRLEPQKALSVEGNVVA
jgi:hypothetical protein